MNEYQRWCIEPDCKAEVWVTGGRNGVRRHRYKWCREHAVARMGHRKGPDRMISQDGYVWVRRDDGAKVPEHRLVMEQKLGRPLVAGESVHHKNGNRADNKRSNLELWTGTIRYGQRASDLVCPHCGRSYTAPL